MVERIRDQDLPSQTTLRADIKRAVALVIGISTSPLTLHKPGVLNISTLNIQEYGLNQWSEREALSHSEAASSTPLRRSAYTSEILRDGFSTVRVRLCGDFVASETGCASVQAREMYNRSRTSHC